MNKDSVNIRDPYVMKSNGKYYLYGTRSETTWGKADSFDCYESDDLIEWDGPFEIFHKSEDAPFDNAYWAPECYEIGGKYYLITTFGSPNKKKAIYALVSDSPKGPFVMHSEGSLSPEGWCCIDGTLHFEKDGKIYMICSHSFEDVPTGDMIAIEISSDLKKSVGESWLLFDAVKAPWAKPVPFAKKEFNMDGDVYFTDGPCSYEMKDGTLMIIWSSWSDQGYAVGMAVSDDGTIKGNWSHISEKLYPGNGGHGMVLETYDGKLKYSMHYPNEMYKEHPNFFDLKEINGKLELI